MSVDLHKVLDEAEICVDICVVYIFINNCTIIIDVIYLAFLPRSLFIQRWVDTYYYLGNIIVCLCDSDPSVL